MKKLILVAAVFILAVSCTDSTIESLPVEENIEELKSNFIKSQFEIIRFIRSENQKSRGRLFAVAAALKELDTETAKQEMENCGLIAFDQLTNLSREFSLIQGQLLWAIGEEKFAGYLEKEFKRQLKEKIPEGRSTSLAGTPCYDEWEAAYLKAQTDLLGCLFQASLAQELAPIAAGYCVIQYALNAIFAEAAYQRCMENTY